MKHGIYTVGVFVVSCSFCIATHAMEDNHKKKDGVLRVDKNQQMPKVLPTKKDHEKIDDGIVNRRSFLTEGDFERIRREPEGCELCMCNAGCCAMMLSVVLAFACCR